VKEPWDRIFFGVIVLYILLSLYRLADAPPIWYDEIAHLNTAQHLACDGKFWCDFYTHKFGGVLFNSMPLQWVILGLVIKIFGLSIFAARLTYCVLSVMTLWGCIGLRRGCSQEILP
jgi:hypothetical protein